MVVAPRLLIVRLEVKLNEYTIFYDECWWDAHLPYLGLKSLKSLMHGQCDARPTVTFPVAGHCCPLLVPNYTAWWQRRMRVNNLPSSGVERATARVATPYTA